MGNNLGKALSFDRALYVAYVNIEKTKEYEVSQLNFINDEVLSSLYYFDTTHFFELLDTPLTAYFSDLMIIENEVADKSHSNILWCAIQKDNALDTARIISRASEYSEYSLHSENGAELHCFHLKNEETGEPGDPIYFYLDAHMLIQGTLDQLKNIGKNSTDIDYWSDFDVQHNFFGLHVVDIKSYQPYLDDILKSISENENFIYIKQAKIELTSNSVSLKEYRNPGMCAFYTSRNTRFS